MLKLPFGLESKYKLSQYPFKIKKGSKFLYKNKEYYNYTMLVDDFNLNKFKKVYETFVKNKCIGRTLPVKDIGTMKLEVNLTEQGLQNFYLFHAKFIKYLKVLGITQVISLTKKQLRELADYSAEQVGKYLVNNFNIATNTEIDLGKTTLSINCLLLANVYNKIVDKCNEGVDFGTNFYDFIDTLKLTTQEKMLINSRLKKIDNTFFYIFGEEK